MCVNANTSGITSITNNGTTYFRNSSTAGAATINNQNTIEFLDNSTARQRNDHHRWLFSTPPGLTFPQLQFRQKNFFKKKNPPPPPAQRNDPQIRTEVGAGSAPVPSFASTSSAGSATITNFDSLCCAFFLFSRRLIAATITSFGTTNFVQTSTAEQRSASPTTPGLSFFGSATLPAAQRLPTMVAAAVLAAACVRRFQHGG